MADNPNQHNNPNGYYGNPQGQAPPPSENGYNLNSDYYHYRAALVNNFGAVDATDSRHLHPVYLHQNNYSPYPSRPECPEFYSAPMYPYPAAAASPPIMPGGPMPSTPSASSSSSTMLSFNASSPHTPSPNQNGTMNGGSPVYFSQFGHQHPEYTSDIESIHNISAEGGDEGPGPVRSPRCMAQPRLTPYQTSTDELFTQKLKNISLKVEEQDQVESMRQNRSRDEDDDYFDSQDEEQSSEQTVLRASITREDGLKMNVESASWKTGKTRTRDKYRVVYSDRQRVELEKEFHYSRYITIRRKSELANYLMLSERQVKIWFQNRRAKERKQTKKNGGREENGDHQVGQPPHAQSFVPTGHSHIIPQQMDMHSFHHQYPHIVPSPAVRHYYSPISQAECNLPPHYGAGSETLNEGAPLSPSNSSAIDVKPDLNHPHSLQA